MNIRWSALRSKSWWRACFSSHLRWRSSTCRSASGAGRFLKDCSRYFSWISMRFPSCSLAGSAQPWRSFHCGERCHSCGPWPSLVAIVVTKAFGIGGAPSWIKVEKGDQPQRPSIAASKPAILHLILDEHIGVEGLPKDNPDAARLQWELRDFYLSRGFALYGGAYSDTCER